MIGELRKLEVYSNKIVPRNSLTKLNNKIIDVTILDCLYTAEEGAYIKHALQLATKELHPSTFEKRDTKKAEAVRRPVFPLLETYLHYFLQLFADKTVATLQMLMECEDDQLLLTAICALRNNESIHSLRIGISTYVDFTNAVPALYCPMTVLSPHQWKRYSSHSRSQ